jgi:sugar phosphate isomerase/epimerase
MSEMTRRDFAVGLLGGGGALAGAAAALGWPRVAWAEGTAGKVKPSVVGGVLVGVQSYTYRKLSLDRMIASMRSVGLSSVELWEGHLHPTKNSPQDFEAARKKLGDAGITVSAYCTGFKNDADEEYLDRAFAGATLLGANVITTSCEKPIVPKLDEWAQRSKVKVGLHNHWLGDAWFKGSKAANFEGPADWAEALQGRSEWMAINLDIGHFAAAGHDPIAFFKENHARVVSLHVKDRGPDAEHKDVRFGQGATPIAAFAKVLKEYKYAYAANLEYEIEENEPTEGLRDAFQYFSKALA